MYDLELNKNMEYGIHYMISFGLGIKTYQILLPLLLLFQLIIMIVSRFPLMDHQIIVEQLVIWL